MTVSELKNHIESNVYENTSGAISGGILQDVIENLAACILGYASSGSGAAKLPTSESADVMAKLVLNFTDKALGTMLSDSRSLAMRLASNQYFKDTLNINSAVISALKSSEAGWTIASNNGFCNNVKYYIYSQLAGYSEFNRVLASFFASYAGMATNGDSTNLAYCLANNASFVSWMKEKLGL